MPKTREGRILALLAEEFDAVRAELERLGMALCVDPETARRHIHDLQALDHIGQRQAAIAAILRSPDRVAAAGDARLEAVRQRLDAA